MSEDVRRVEIVEEFKLRIAAIIHGSAEVIATLRRAECAAGPSKEAN